MSTFDAAQQSQHWHALLESAGEGIWGLDLEGNCTFANRMAQEILGFEAEEMLGRNMHRLVHHHTADGRVYPAEQCSIYAVFRKGTPFLRQHDTMFRKGGQAFLAEVSAHPVFADDAISGVVVTFRDVTESYQQQAELEAAYQVAAKRTAELEALVESMPHGVYVATRDDSPMRLNKRAREMASSAFPGELDALHQAMAGVCSTELREHEGRWLRSVGAPVVLHGEIIGGVAVNTDVTQERLQDEALRRSEGLAAIGQIASAIAHEIKDPLAIVNDCLFLIKSSESLAEMQQYAAEAQDQLARVSEITLQTLSFHRAQTRPVLADLAAMARAVLLLYRSVLLVRRVTLIWEIRATPPVLCMEGAVRQVLNNLVRNAVEAMSDGGHLTIRVNRECDGESHALGVRLTVADTGEGISPAMQERLYEPFQTTKEATGTGLGLWVSNGIVEKHGGRMRMRTRRGRCHGTLFSVWLPVDGPVAETTRAAPVTN